MGAYSNAMYTQAQDDFCQALHRLFMEEFQRGADGLGESTDPEVLVHTIKALGLALTEASAVLAQRFEVEYPF